MWELDRWHLAAALGDLDAVTDQDAPAVDAQRLGKQPQHHLAPQLCEPVELHGGAVEAIEEGIVAPSVELQRAHNAGYAQQFRLHRDACHGGGRTTGRFAGGRTPGTAARSRSTSASTMTSGRLVVVSDQRSSYPEHHCNDVESLVIPPESIVSLATAVTSGAILIRWSSGARNIPWRTIPSSKAFSNGWTPPRDNSPSRHSIRSSTHWNMPASMPGTARSSGPTANGYRSSSRWSASTLSIRACLATRSKLTCWAGSKTVRQNPAPNTNSRNSTGSSSRGSKIMSARYEPPGSSRELGTLELNAYRHAAYYGVTAAQVVEI